MDRLEEPNEVFTHLGLSRYEAKAYHVLILEGASEARKLSLKCGVPRTKIYLTLKKLKERNLVYELPETPSKYAPISPSEAFHRYISAFKEETAEKVISLMECTELVEQLEAVYNNSKSTVNPRKEEVWVLTQKKKITTKIREILLHASQRVKIVTTPEGLIFLYKMGSKLIDTLVNRGVTIEILTPMRPDSFVVRELKHIVSVTHLEVNVPVLYICVDQAICLLVKCNLTDFNLDAKGNFGILCENPEVCSLFDLFVLKSVS